MVRAEGDVIVSATDFALEENYDFLTIDDVPYSGTVGPSGVALTAGSTFTFTSDYATEHAGFVVCAVYAPPRLIE